MRGFSFLVALAVALVVSVTASERKAALCKECRHLGRRVAQRMEETGAHSDDEVSIGSRINADGTQISGKVVRYGDSEQRLMDVLEKVCDNSQNVSACHALLHKKDDDISNWFYEQRRNLPFEDAVCTECAESLAVEVEDESDSAAVKNKEGSSAEAGKSKKSKKAKKAAPVTDSKFAGPIDALRSVLNRMASNFDRTRTLLFAFVQAIYLAVRFGNKSKLDAIVSDPQFLKKHWTLFVALFLIGYSISSTVVGFVLSRRKRPATARGGNASGATRSSSRPKRTVRKNATASD